MEKSRIKLELEEITILRPKKKWQLYFVVVAEHPEDQDKMMLATMPELLIRLRAPMNNNVQFEPEGEGVDGYTVLERDMPVDRNIKVRLFIRHSRANSRKAGDVLNEFREKLGDDVFEVLESAMGVQVPWLVISKKSLEIIGSLLAEIRDRDLGMINMDESFGPEFENQTELDRANNSSTGEAHLVWSWSIAE